MPTFNVPATFTVGADSPERAVEVVDSFCDYGMQVSNDEQAIEQFASWLEMSLSRLTW